MNNKHQKIFIYWLIGISAAIGIFIWGLFTWLTAGQYTPDTPMWEPVKKFNPPKQLPTYPLSKYQSLLTGKLFFGYDSPVNGSQVFSSNLVIWGMVHNNYAVVGIDPQSNQNTDIVKAGDIVAGEKILKVGDNYILVKNQSGEGKIYFGN